MTTHGFDLPLSETKWVYSLVTSVVGNTKRNMDHSFMQGVEVVSRLLSGEPEKTFAAGRG